MDRAGQEVTIDFMGFFLRTRSPVFWICAPLGAFCESSLEIKEVVQVETKRHHPGKALWAATLIPGFASLDPGYAAGSLSSSSEASSAVSAELVTSTSLVVAATGGSGNETIVPLAAKMTSRQFAA